MLYVCQSQVIIGLIVANLLKKKLIFISIKNPASCSTGSWNWLKPVLFFKVMLKQLNYNIKITFLFQSDNIFCMFFSRGHKLRCDNLSPLTTLDLNNLQDFKKSSNSTFKMSNKSFKINMLDYFVFVSVVRDGSWEVGTRLLPWKWVWPDGEFSEAFDDNFFAKNRQFI